MTCRRLAAVLCSLAFGLVPSLAHPETLLTAFGGVAFGGATDETRGTYGAALGFLGDGPFGFEVEFATTPEFFGNAREDVFSENNVLTLMGSFLLATPDGGVRLYAALGGGLLKTRLADADRLLNIDSNDFGIGVGGGLLGSLGEHVALRVDVRYFRDLEDPDPDGGFDVDLGNVDYWRAVAGITFKF
jgi:opacity protein-like surface antigen